MNSDLLDWYLSKTPEQQNIIAEILLHEAENQSNEGMARVAQVIKNRELGSGKPLSELVDSTQFSNFKYSGGERFSPEQMQRAKIAVGTPIKNTQDTHYYNPEIAGKKPWMDHMTDTEKVEEHLFGHLGKYPEDQYLKYPQVPPLPDRAPEPPSPMQKIADRQAGQWNTIKNRFREVGGGAMEKLQSVLGGRSIDEASPPMRLSASNQAPITAEEAALNAQYDARERPIELKAVDERFNATSPHAINAADILTEEKGFNPDGVKMVQDAIDKDAPPPLPTKAPAAPSIKKLTEVDKTVDIPTRALSTPEYTDRMAFDDQIIENPPQAPEGNWFNESVDTLGDIVEAGIDKTGNIFGKIFSDAEVQVGKKTPVPGMSLTGEQTGEGNVAEVPSPEPEATPVAAPVSGEPTPETNSKSPTQYTDGRTVQPEVKSKGTKPSKETSGSPSKRPSRGKVARPSAPKPQKGLMGGIGDELTGGWFSKIFGGRTGGRKVRPRNLTPQVDPKQVSLKDDIATSMLDDGKFDFQGAIQRGFGVGL